MDVCMHVHVRTCTKNLRDRLYTQYCTCGTAFDTWTSVLGGLGGGVSCTRTFLTAAMDSILMGTGG